MKQYLMAAALMFALVLPGCGFFGVSDIITGAEAGVAFIKQGKFESFDEVTFEDALAAGRRAGNNLSLKLYKEDIQKDTATLKWTDLRGQDVALTLQRRSPTVTACFIDVGILGTTGIGRITLAEYINQLLSMHAYKQKWERAPEMPPAGTQPVSSSRALDDDHSPLGGASGLMIPQREHQPVVTVEPR